LHLWVLEELESRHLRAIGQAGFHLEHQMTHHIFILRAIMEEAHYHSLKVFCYFVDFYKAFDMIP
jgi:hypothetical protein